MKRALFITAVAVLLLSTFGFAQELPPHPREKEIFEQLAKAPISLWSYKVYDTDVIKDICAEVGASQIKLRAFADSRRDIVPARLAGLMDELPELQVEVWFHTRGSTSEEDLEYLAELYPLVADKENFSGVMINAEHDFSAKQARKFIGSLGDLRDKYAPNSLIGFTSYCVIDRHMDKVPFDEIMESVDYFAPQVYWGHNGSSPTEYLDRGYSTWLKQGERLGFDPIIVPVGQTYWSEGVGDVKRGELREFVRETKSYMAVSFYSIDELVEKPWAITELAKAFEDFRPDDLVVASTSGQSKKSEGSKRGYLPWILGLALLYLVCGLAIASYRGKVDLRPILCWPIDMYKFLKRTKHR